MSDEQQFRGLVNWPSTLHNFEEKSRGEGGEGSGLDLGHEKKYFNIHMKSLTKILITIIIP